VRSAWVIGKREIYSFFVTPMSTIVLVSWLLYQGLCFYYIAVLFARQFANQEASWGVSQTPLSMFFGGIVLFYFPFFVVVPALTMRLLAEEKRTGTFESLVTAPISEISLVMGKYFAAMVFWVALWAPTLIYVLIISFFGDVDWGVVGSCYLGVLGVGLYYMAIGLFMSAVSSSQIVSAILTFIVMAMLFLLGLGEFFAEGTTLDVLKYLSLWNHMSTFGRGIVDSRALVFDASLALLFLSMTLAVVVGPRREATGQHRRFVAHASISTVLVLVIVGMVNTIAIRRYVRWDWTSEGYFTLSERTRQELRALTEPIDVYVFLSETEPNFPEIRELLDRYRAETARLTTHFVDPDREPAEYRLLAQRFGIGTASVEGATMAEVAAVVTKGDRRWTVNRDDLVGFDFGSGEDEQGPRMDVKGEQALTGAIVQVTTGRPTKVCVTSGHGERSVEAGERSLTTLEDELRRDNVELETITTAGASRIDSSCDAVFVVGPLRAFPEQEAALLERYVRAGGNLLLALDPIIDHDQVQPTGLEAMARRLGVEIDSSLVLELDPERLTVPPSPAGPFIVGDFGDGDHPTVRSVAAMGTPFVVAVARGIRPKEGGNGTVLMRTSERGYGETQLGELVSGSEPAPGEGDQPGPVSIAVALQLGEPEPSEPAEDAEDTRAPVSGRRVVVIGDSDWLGDALRSPELSNVDVAASVTGWLAAREALVAIRPRQIRAIPMAISEDDLSGIAMRVLLLMPAALLILGFSTWWSRRS